MGSFFTKVQDSPNRLIAILRDPEEGQVLSDEQRRFADNSITTSKYNLLTYIPRSLLEQFRRAANVYFLFISILMIIGTYTSLFTSPLTPYSTLGPLLIVMSLTMAKEGVDDLKRHRSDRFVNTRRTHQLKLKAPPLPDGHIFKSLRWKDVKPGMLIKIQAGDEVPADIVLLTSSEASGVAYIETAEIDGETNLKIRVSAPTKRTLPPGPIWETPEEMMGLDMEVECERPNDRIHFFSGTLRMRLAEEDGEEREVPLDQSNLLLRGASLRNTKWAIGVVVYTGKESKVSKNQREAPSKHSNVDKTTNKIMVVIFGAMAMVTTLSLIAYIIFKAEYESDLYYLCYDSDNSPIPLFRDNCDSSSTGSDAGYWFTFLILYNNFVPISLYVTLEMVNYMQALYIDSDLEMYDESQDTPALARTSGLAADLGQIEYVFSDKTGTLTQNIMTFRRCSVAGQMYGEITAAEKAKMTPHQRLGVVDAPPLTQLASALSSAGPDDAATHFALCLALNHTVVVETDEKTGERVLQAESPDESALVDGGEGLGITFKGRDPGLVHLTLQHNGSADGTKGSATEGGGGGPPKVVKDLTYSLLLTIPFDSTRKRMSIVVKSPEGRYFVYCKGADNIIMDRAITYNGSSLATVVAHLGVFANDGLRTLLLAKRELPEKEFMAWYERYKDASVQTEGRPEAIAKVAMEVESDLDVVGVTAIEDKLQDDVAGTIADIGKAGVKVWVLTGDKMETAINIGYSCRLLEPDMTLIKIKEGGAAGSVGEQLDKLLSHFSRLTDEAGIFQQLWRRTLGLASLPGLGRSRGGGGGSGGGGGVGGVGGGGGRGSGAAAVEASPLSDTLLQQPSGSPPLAELSSDSLAMVIDGPTLNNVLGIPAMEIKLLKIAKLCKSVVACRVSPKQKANIVRLVKRRISPTPLTLAIGDGANDVGMIQEAQVGIGISGREGRQAVNNCDFAIAQFRFLRQLMLVHGHWDYRRMCKVILYSFYKNIVLTFILFYYIFFSGVSGQSLYESIVYSGFNWFLAFPPLLMGVFDKDVSEGTAVACQKLYRIGINNVDMNLKVMCKMIVQAILDSFLIFFLPYAAYNKPRTVWAERGYADGIFVFGTTVYTVLILSMLLKCASMTRTWTKYSFAGIIFSVLFYTAFLLGYSSLVDYAFDFYGVAYQMMSRGTFWLLVIQVPCLSWCADSFVMWVEAQFFPTVSNHAIEFDRGYTSEKGVDLLTKIKDHHDLREQEDHAGLEPAAEMDADTGVFRLNKASLHMLNAGVPAADLEGLGMTVGAEQRSSYAYDHVSANFGEGARDRREQLHSLRSEEGFEGMEVLRQRSASFREVQHSLGEESDKDDDEEEEGMAVDGGGEVVPLGGGGL